MEHILVLDRQSQNIITETPPGKKGLVWLYNESKFSRLAVKILANSRPLSYLYASFQKSFISKFFIPGFIQKHKIDPNEFLENPKTFKSFNHFFERRLKTDARPIDIMPNRIVSPADGRLKVLYDLESFDVKGSIFDIKKFLHFPHLNDRFMDAKLVAIRLAPCDYHRLHAPMDATVRSIHEVEGPLFSVSPIALKKNWGILNENKRVIIDFDHFLLVLVGATFVGTIHLEIEEGQTVKKGEEIGWFSFGGSMCVCCFKPTVDVDLDLFHSDVEVKVRMGESIASLD